MSENVADAENLLLASITIKQMLTDDGTEMISLETVDADGSPLGLIESLNLIEYSKLQLEAEVIRSLVFESDDEDDDDE